MSDEARHVAFGVLSLKEYYDELTLAEIEERQDFAFEAAIRMRQMIPLLLAQPPEENEFDEDLDELARDRAHAT